MGRGYIFGLLIGALASAASLVGISLVLPSDKGTTIVDGSGVAPEPVETASLAGDETPSVDPDAMAEPDQTVEEQEPVAGASEAVDSASDPVVNVADAVEQTAESPEPVEMVAPDPTQTADEQAETEVDIAEAVPETPVVEVPAGSEFTRPKSEEDPIVPAAEPEPAAVSKPVVVAPEVEPAPSLAEVSPADIPEGQSAAPSSMAAPESAEGNIITEAPTAEESAPVLSTPQGAAPVLDAGTEPDTAISEPETAPPPAEPEPLPETDIATAEPETATDDPEEVEAVAEDTEGEVVVAEAPPLLPDETEIAAIADAPVIDEAPNVPAEEAPVAETPPTDSTPSQPAPAEAAPEPSLPAEAPAEPETDTEAAQGTEVAEADTGPVVIDFSPAKPIGAASAPKVGFSQKVPGVKINRLPRIGDTEPSVQPAVQTEVTDAPAAPGDGNALDRFAAPFDNPESLPLLSVILIEPEAEEQRVDPEALALLGVPVTVAIDPNMPDAAARAVVYRLSGNEVAILAPELPPGATASDLEISYQGYVNALPESVALIGAPDTAYQSNRRVAQHLVALLASEGRGLVTYERGLDPARQAALGAGLSHAAVYRVLDGQNEDAAMIRRYLDRAGFEAARAGQVLVVGKAVPETISAIQDWIASGAKGTKVAPVSAMMKAGS